MKVNLDIKEATNDLNASDVVVYRSGGIEESYYMIVEDCTDKFEYKLLDLSDGTIAITWNNKEDMIKNIIKSDNGWFFDRIIKSEELELRRI